MAKLKDLVDKLSVDLSWIREQTGEVERFARQIDTMTKRISSSFDRLVLHDRTRTFLRQSDEPHALMVKSLEQGEKEHMLISGALPKRGWYLSGQEPLVLTRNLATAVRKRQWDNVDQEMMAHLPQFDLQLLAEWMNQEGVPDWCINRLHLFLKHHDAGNYEESTFLGVPLLDEVAKFLYGGKTFTSKRSARRRDVRSKPELAYKTSNGPELESYCESFVQAFGSLQEDPKHASLADENYWNRHAIVHGLMQRAMGIKDSSKCLMAIGFLCFARKDLRAAADGGTRDEAATDN